MARRRQIFLSDTSWALQLAAGRPETKSEGWIYCHFESGGGKVARFNLRWLLKGGATADGRIPEDL